MLLKQIKINKTNLIQINKLNFKNKYKIKQLIIKKVK